MSIQRPLSSQGTTGRVIIRFGAMSMPVVVTAMIMVVVVMIVRFLLGRCCLWMICCNRRADPKSHSDLQDETPSQGPKAKEKRVHNERSTLEKGFEATPFSEQSSLRTNRHRCNCNFYQPEVLFAIKLHKIPDEWAPAPRVAPMAPSLFSLLQVPWMCVRGATECAVVPAIVLL